jgi:8-oxo-dGTP pyrophosphatase MutT (NUDIX family)
MVAPLPVSVLVYPVAPGTLSHEYLLLRRVPSEGGFWQGVTGGVEPPETLDEAAIRELTEETRLTPMGLVPTHYHYTFALPGEGQAGAGKPLAISEYVFLAVLASKVDPTIDPAEHDAWDWFTFEDALRWLRWPENIEGLKRCEALIRRARTPRTTG